MHEITTYMQFLHAWREILTVSNAICDCYCLQSCNLITRICFLFSLKSCYSGSSNRLQCINMFFNYDCHCISGICRQSLTRQLCIHQELRTCTTSALLTVLYFLFLFQVHHFFVLIVGCLQVWSVLEASWGCCCEWDNKCSQGVEATLAPALHGQAMWIQALHCTSVVVIVADICVINLCIYWLKMAVSMVFDFLNSTVQSM